MRSRSPRRAHGQGEDLEYPHSESDDYTWTETYYLPISLHEEHVLGHVYCAARPVLGSMQNDIRFSGSVSDNEFDLLYIDSQNHLPAPERFSNLAGPNGLTVRRSRLRATIGSTASDPMTPRSTST